MVLTVVMTFTYYHDDAEYDLNNPFDPANMDLDPPGLFHPFETEKIYRESDIS